MTSAVKRCQRIGGTIQAGGKSSRSQILSSRWACLARSRAGSHARLLRRNHRTDTLGSGGSPVDCRGVHRCGYRYDPGAHQHQPPQVCAGGAGPQGQRPGNDPLGAHRQGCTGVYVVGGIPAMSERCPSEIPGASFKCCRIVLHNCTTTK